MLHNKLITTDGPTIYWGSHNMNTPKLWSPEKIHTGRSPIGSLILEHANYTIPGGGRNSELENEDTVSLKKLTVNGRTYLIAMVLDGLSGVLKVDRTIDGASLGRFASQFIASSLTEHLRALEDITERTLTRAILEANRDLHMINVQNGMKKPSEGGATMLSMVVITDAGEALFAQVGDAQYMYPAYGLTEKGDQELLGELQQWVLHHSPNKDSTAFFKEQFDLLMNRTDLRTLDHDVRTAFIEPFHVETSLATRDPKGLIFSALNGDAAVEQFIKVRTLPLRPGHTFALYSDGIIDGLSSESLLRTYISNPNMEQSLREMDTAIRENIIAGRNLTLKRWGDDQSIVVIRAQEK